jgi:hypothetical protein
LSLAWWQGEGITRLFLQVLIINDGPATVVRNYEVRVRVVDGTLINGILSIILPGTKIQTETHIVPVDPILYEVTTAIPTGAQAGGWLAVELPAPRERLRRGDTTIILSFRDAKGKRYFTQCPGTGRGEPGVSMYYPGAGSIPELMPSPSSTPDKEASPPKAI